MTSDRQLKRDTWRRLSDEQYNQHWFARVRAKSIIDANGCLIWQGFLQTKGYGGTTYRGRNVAIHRQAFKLLKKADLRTEDFVCHACDQRACWNDNHLFLGTAKINNRDCGNKGRHHNGVKTVCKHGHPFTIENTHLKITATTVMRVCKECTRIKSRREWENGKALERQRRYRAKLRTQKMGASQ